VSTLPEGHKGGEGKPGELVGVAFSSDAIEAEMIKGLLENAGIPSLLQQTGLHVDGPQLGIGLLPRGFSGGSHRVMVHANRVEEASALLAETLVERGDDGEPEDEDEDESWTATANARHLREFSGGEPRSYGLFGAYARIYLFSFAVLALVFGAFLLLRAA
jgi:Putative prokaryotic signal transducing protein